MKIYHALSKVPVLSKHYNLKILAVAFVGIHIPLFGIIGYLLITQLPEELAITLGVFTLIFTLAATAITLIILNKLLLPVLRAKNTLNAYLYEGKVESIPAGYRDEVGVLMTDVHRAINALQTFEKERSNTLQMLSHDLQSPARSALSMIDFIKEESSEDERLSMLNLLEQAIKKQLNQLNDSMTLLRSAQFEGGTRNLMHEVSLDVFTQKIIQGFEHQTLPKELTINYTKIKMDVHIPERELRMVLTNVLDNAIKFSSKGSQIDVSASVLDNSLEFRITDKGMGFEPSRVEDIFQYNSPMMRKGTGDEASHGIGMHLCRKMIEAVGGSINAISEGPGQGSTFTITLPCEH